MPDRFSVQRFQEAEQRIRSHVRRTPVEASPVLSETGGGEVFLKLENFQATGSFKLRGVMNTLLGLERDRLEAGVVAASTGNHGAAVAQGVKTLGGMATVFVPENASPAKLDWIRTLGGEVRLVGDDCVVAEHHARQHAATHDLAYISPYNDEDVILGQGTIGVELHEQLEKLDTIYIALGGGGLLSGTAAYLKRIMPNIHVVACSATNSAVMHHSLAAGRILDMESKPTLSDGTAGGLEEGSITFEMCQSLIDRHVLVSEASIASAVRLVIEHQHMLIEGAAGVAVAGYLQDTERPTGQRAAIVLCGANISPDTLRTILGTE